MVYYSMVSSLREVWFWKKAYDHPSRGPSTKKTKLMTNPFKSPNRFRLSYNNSIISGLNCGTIIVIILITLKLCNIIRSWQGVLDLSCAFTMIATMGFICFNVGTDGNAKSRTYKFSPWTKLLKFLFRVFPG